MKSLPVKDWIDSQRDQLQLSQSEMAVKMKISLSTYAKLVSGDTPVRPAHFWATCLAAGADYRQALKQVEEFDQFSPEKLIDALKRRPVSAEAFKKKGLNPSAVKYFRRGAVPTREKLEALAATLGLKPIDLCEPFHELVIQTKKTWEDSLVILRRKGSAVTKSARRKEKSGAARASTSVRRDVNEVSPSVLVLMPRTTWAVVRDMRGVREVLPEELVSTMREAISALQ